MRSAARATSASDRNRAEAQETVRLASTKQREQHSSGMTSIVYTLLTCPAHFPARFVHFVI